MTAFDDEFVPLALEMITEDGKSVTFMTYPLSLHDATTGRTTLGRETNYTKFIIPPYAYEEKYINGDTVKSGDMKTGVAASGLGFVPNPSETKVIIDSVEWSIVNVNPIYSGEQIALYMLQLRK